jgi:outer membrane protein
MVGFVRFFLFSSLAISSLSIAAVEPKPLGLEEAVALALRNSAELKQSAAKIESARLEKTSVLTNYLPSLDSSFSRMKSESKVYSPEFDKWNDTEDISNRLTLTMTEGIDLQGKVLRSYKRATYNLNGVEANHRHQASGLIKKVIDLYFTLQESRSSLKGLTANRARITENQKVIETEVTLGRRSRTDAGEIQHAAAKNEIEILRAEQSIRSSLKQLGMLLYGDAYKLPKLKKFIKGREFKFSKNWQKNIIGDDVAAIKAALSTRGDIVSLDNTIRVSNSNRREVYWKFAPDLNFKVDYSRDFSRKANDEEPSDYDQRVSVGLVATWNIFDGGRDYLKMRQNHHSRISDEYRHRSTFENSLIEIQDEREKLISQDKLVSASVTLLSTAKQKYESIKAQYQYGKISTTDLLKAEVDYTDAQIGWGSEQFKFLRQYAKVQHLSGKLQSLFN